MGREPGEFIRRVLIHLLPPGFMGIRHCGLFANRRRRQKLARCRERLNQPAPEPRAEERVEPIMLRLTGRDIRVCPHRGQGRLQTIAILEP